MTSAKRAFTTRLGDNWRDLVDVLKLPQHDVRTFERGCEASAIWDWLELRKRLDDLLPALEAIDRDDLSRTLVEMGVGQSPPVFPEHEVISAPTRAPAPVRDRRRNEAWTVPDRVSWFVGRDELIKQIRRDLTKGRRVATTAEGLGGVGKTAVAIEYVYRYRREYEIVWWVDAEQTALIGNQLARLAVDVGLVDISAGVPAAVAAIRDYLLSSSRWLLVFDNATGSAGFDKWIPRGSGHVLITSRSHDWSPLANSVTVDVFSEHDSFEYLTQYLPFLNDDEVERLARALGDLPLALAQAARFINRTQVPVDDYLAYLHLAPRDALDRHAPFDHPESLTAAIHVAMGSLASEHDPLVQWARFCSLMAPDPIPLPRADGATSTSSVVAIRDYLARIAEYGLVRVTRESATMHRLTQAVIARTMTEQERIDARTHADMFLVNAFPGGPDDPSAWEGWGRLLPHILVADLDNTTNRRLQGLVCAALCYVLDRGDLSLALSLAERLHHAWLTRCGPDDTMVLAMAGKLTMCLFRLGRTAEARRLAEDTWRRQCALMGADHPNTLATATNLGTTRWLDGDPAGAHAIWLAAYEGHWRVQGEDHVWTLRTGTCLVESFAELGDPEMAIEVGEDTFQRQRRIIGENHPDTLITASNLASCLRGLGEYKKARDLEQDTLDRRERFIGPDHPATMTSVFNLAQTLDRLGEGDRARELAERAYDRRCAVLGESHPDTRRVAAFIECLHAV
jgi:hypothetical protein